jgi:drug/metabolite transporter (DMT)-like permease
MSSVAVMAAVVKWASYGFSSELLMLVRWGSGLLVFGAYWALTGRVSLRTTKWLTQSMLGVCWTLGVFVYYVSLRTVPLMDATLLLNTSALFAPLLAFALAGKQERWTVWFGSLIGFAGVVAVLRPGSSVFQPMSLLALLAGFLMALRVFLNSLLGGEPKQRTTFYSLAVGTTVCLALLAAEGFRVAPPDWQRMLFTPREIAEPMFVDASLVVAVAALGLLAMVQPLLIAWSLQYASVGETAPFRYTSVVLAAGIDWLIWNHVPSGVEVLGLVLIAIGATVILMTRRSATHTTAPPAGASTQDGTVQRTNASQ